MPHHQQNTSPGVHPPSVQETQETQLQSLGQEDPLEEDKATHSNILAWKIPWTEESGGAMVQRVTKSWIKPSNGAWAHDKIIDKE